MTDLDSATALNAYELALIRNVRRINEEGQEAFLLLSESYIAAFPLATNPRLWLVPSR
jgi:hypothetical protein